jgi:hypothetical protein
VHFSVYTIRFWKVTELVTRARIAMTVRTAALGQSSAHPAPRRITPHEASTIHLVGTSLATYQKNAGIESSGKMYPERNIEGITVPIDICIDASRVYARVEIHSPAPSIVRKNGSATVRSVRKLPRMGTWNIVVINKAIQQNSTIVSPR